MQKSNYQRLKNRRHQRHINQAGKADRVMARPGGNFKRPKRNQRNCYRYLTVYWCVALAQFIGLVDGRFRSQSSSPPPPTLLAPHSQMEMQNVKFEKRAKRLKLIRLGVFGTGCPGSPASHFSKHTDGQGTDINSRFALSVFRFPHYEMSTSMSISKPSLLPTKMWSRSKRWKKSIWKWAAKPTMILILMIPLIEHNENVCKSQKLLNGLLYIIKEHL